MTPDIIGDALALALAIVVLLAAFGATAITYGRDSRFIEDPRTDVSPWR